jgi:antirestriction protein ArdC
VREIEDDGKKREQAFLRYFTAFNLEQCEGIEAPSPIERPSFNPIERCEEVLSTYRNPPPIQHGGSQAFYLPSLDRIQLPPRGAFDRTEEYYSTLFHELVHSSGAAHRLARKGVVDGARFASHAYSKEELVAEIGAAFLCAHTGIAPQTFENSHAYISFWMSALIGDSRMVIEASSQAAKAVDLILGKSAECVETSEEAA